MSDTISSHFIDEYFMEFDEFEERYSILIQSLGYALKGMVGTRYQKIPGFTYFCDTYRLNLKLEGDFVISLNNPILADIFFQMGAMFDFIPGIIPISEISRNLDISEALVRALIQVSSDYGYRIGLVRSNIFAEFYGLIKG